MQNPIAAASVTLWQDPRALWTIAILACLMLTGAWMLARRRRGQLNRAAIACAIVSVILHGVLIALLPYARFVGDGNRRTASAPTPDRAATRVNLSQFSHVDPTDQAADSLADSHSIAPPLPIAPLELPRPDPVASPKPPSMAEDSEASTEEAPTEEARKEVVPGEKLPASIDLPSPPALPPIEFPAATSFAPEVDAQLDALITQILATNSPEPAPPETASTQPVAPQASAQDTSAPQPKQAELTEVQRAAPDAESSATDSHAANASLPDAPPPHTTTAPNPAFPPSPSPPPVGRVFGSVPAEFASRQGESRQRALLETGGDAETEAAVRAALLWLDQYQRADGAWDPAQSGAGQERHVLGQFRHHAGSRATTGISGLALLAMLGSSHTHQAGDHQRSVRAGLQYLLGAQGADGSLMGDADPYARTYCHGMAALAMCEAAVLTGDPVALDSARRAVTYTINTQHPTTGGWRYVPGDPGDMSQHGWQAMVLCTGAAAGVEIPAPVIARTQTFLRSVRAGRTGGLASYKPGQPPSRTMTAEALAVRLLLGEQVPEAEIAEAEAYLLEEMPGMGTDNYYYWYYASIALHQLQSDAWRRWNERMKQRLLATQLPDGSWPTTSLWGGHGGKVYTTAMACLCLEVYYRHAADGERQIAAGPATPPPLPVIQR